MYMIFQVASDDEMTQRNGLVAVYAKHESALKDFVELAVHQRESNRFFDAVPVRYSAFHCFLSDKILRGMVLTMIGKRTRLITRMHTGMYSIKILKLNASFFW